MIFFSWFLLPRGHLGRCKVLRWNLPLWVSLAWAGSSFSNHLSGGEQQSGILRGLSGKGDAQGIVQRMAERHQGRKQGLATIFFIFLFSQQVFLLLCSGFCPWSGFRDHILGSMGGSCGLYKMSLFLFSFFFFFALFQGRCICRCNTE